jgi:mRNA-degrading endonuclease RelE of RelBE toxin-antitoxin system
MKVKAFARFKKSYEILPKNIQNKVDRQLKVLCEDFYHPSLHTKKIKGRSGIWEVRVDISYRFTFEIADDTILLRVVGNHNEVLKHP